jgi:hypothetical protein
MSILRSVFAVVAIAFCASFAFVSAAAATEGDPIPGLDVKLVNADGQVIKTVHTDASGKFTCTLDEGVYGVCISHEACGNACAKITKSRSNIQNNRIMLDLDGSNDVVVGDVDGDGKLDRVVAPRDIATGQASGKRMHKPFTITKEWSASSPGAKVSVYGKSKELTGHVTLIK